MSRRAGFIKMNRGLETEEMVGEYAVEFWLLSMIAIRARRHAGLDGLEPGEAFIGKGDAEKAGFSERRYRTAKDRLAKWEKATFSPTKLGTVARLTDTSIYDINLPDNDEVSDEAATKQRRLTNNERKEEKKTMTDKLVRDGFFDDFWNAYPKRIGKSEAIKAWNKLSPDEALACTIIGAVKKQIEAGMIKTRENLQYCPYPATWLNKRRFDDEVLGAPTVDDDRPPIFNLPNIAR